MPKPTQGLVGAAVRARPQVTSYLCRPVSKTTSPLIKVVLPVPHPRRDSSVQLSGPDPNPPPTEYLMLVMGPTEDQKWKICVPSKEDLDDWVRGEGLEVGVLGIED